MDKGNFIVIYTCNILLTFDAYAVRLIESVNEMNDRTSSSVYGITWKTLYHFHRKSCYSVFLVRAKYDPGHNFATFSDKSCTLCAPHNDFFYRNIVSILIYIDKGVLNISGERKGHSKMGEGENNGVRLIFTTTSIS